LDPVDGTTNFWNGLPLFACSAALLWRGEPVVGAVFIPVVPLPAAAVAVAEGGGLRGMPEPLLRSGVVHARRGGGAFLDGTPIRASSASVPLGSNLVGLPAYHARYFHWSGESGRRPGEPRSLGSVCFEMAMVAAGVLQYSLYRRPKIWDVAAGVLAIREAGGEALAWRRGEVGAAGVLQPHAQTQEALGGESTPLGDVGSDGRERGSLLRSRQDHAHHETLEANFLTHNASRAFTKA